MEVKQWTYEEIPEYTGLPQGARRIATTGDERGALYLHDIEYGEAGGVKLHLQMTVPMSRNAPFNPMPTAEAQAFRYPCFVFVQGSAWMKQYVYANLPQVARLSDRGYVTAIVEYRHSELAHFPAQAVDARNAIRFLRQNAARFGIDPEKIVVAGDSSGGHTALWAALLREDQDEKQNLYPGVSPAVRGVVDFYGSTSVMAPDSNPGTLNHCLPDSPEGMVMGGRNLLEAPELARQLSVECNIAENTPLPPVLIFHGTKDRVVNCEGSAILYERLLATGHPAELYLVEGGDHGGAEFWSPRVLDIIDDFCRRCFA